MRFELKAVDSANRVVALEFEAADEAEARAGAPSARLAAFYGYFDRQDGQVDWLARLYGSARGAGLDLRAADYRLVDTEGRIARYEVVLPLQGTYAQVRAFLADALEENPVLSLDQLNLRRKRANDSVLEAEAVLTVHLLRP
ncbi:MAG: GspMb/PilO family protein [Burkholderiales bacterium]